MSGCEQPRQHYLCVMHLTLSYAMKRIADGRWVRGAASKDECKIGTTQHQHRLARKKESHNIGYEVLGRAYFVECATIGAEKQLIAGFECSCFRRLVSVNIGPREMHSHEAPRYLGP